MPITYEIQRDRRVLRIRMWGEVADEEFVAHVEQIASDGAVESAVARLTDISELTRLPSSAVIRRVAGRDGVVFVLPHAIVARTDLQYGVARIFGALAEAVSPHLQVFRELEEAEAWLASLAPEQRSMGV